MKKNIFCFSTAVLFVVVTLILFVLGVKHSEKTKASLKKYNKDTLLIYMIGSDLEARSGSGTDDMYELEKSGIDLEKTNVVVYAGGSPKWHNDVTNEEKINILLLTENGFVSVAQMDSSSMGTQVSLAEFLNYGYENYPGDSYGLVMWNHGNGPNIGYGKDMLFDNDSLTLSEMEKALQASPFNSENKLSWVGFDACLMSTAELVCLWDDYADYLVASQEVEPSFGWNYSVFNSYNSSETEKFIGKVSQEYLSTCLAYFEKRGFDNREATLACMDLSYGRQLEEAINGLFEKAYGDIDSEYDNLVKQRVVTRSLGRATTGSEYDLVDLEDMAVNLEEMYPKETATLMDVIDKMVLRNDTNAPLCCGLSLYYPFFNKFHYEESWAESYSNLGLFPSYGKYLDKYQKIWLSDEASDSVEKSPVPIKVEDTNRSGGIAGTYKLNLSPEQYKNYAQATVYVLENYHDDIYHKVMSLGNVRNEDGVLYADISGKAIYVKDNLDSRIIPLTEQYDTVGDITRYSLQIMGTKGVPDVFFGIKELQLLDVRMSLNNRTEKFSIESVQNYNPPTKANELTTGKLEEVSLEEWDEYGIWRTNYKYVTRNENGIILPFDKWVGSGGIGIGYQINKEDGLSFAYEPMESDTYYLMFEITDTRGNKYCSELLKIEPPENSEENVVKNFDDLTVDWNKGDEIEIINRSGVTVRLKKQTDSLNRPKYVVEAENSNSYDVYLSFNGTTVSGFYDDPYINMSLDANSVNSTELYCFFSSSAEYLAFFDIVREVDIIQSSVSIEHKNVDAYRIETQNITVNISGHAGFGDLRQYLDEDYTLYPYRGAYAGQQKLYEDGETKITLLGFGTYSNRGTAFILYENLADEPVNVCLGGVSVNGKTYSQSDIRTIPAGAKLFCESSFALAEEIWDLKVNFAKKKSAVANEVADAELIGVPVVLEKSGEKKEYVPEEGIVWYDQNNIKITAVEFELANKVTPKWHVVVENNSDFDISAIILDKDEGYKGIVTTDIASVKSHESAEVSVTYEKTDIYENTEESILNRTVKIQILDYFKDKVLFYNYETIVLEPMEIKSKINNRVVIDTSDRVKIAEVEDAVVYIEKGLNYKEQTVYSLVLDCPDGLVFNATLNMHSLNDGIDISENTYLSKYVSKKGPASEFLNIDLNSLYSFGIIDEVTSLTASLTITKEDENGIKTTLLDSYPLRLEFEGEGRIDFESSGYKRAEITPFKDALAKQQTLFENSKCRISLVFFGANDITKDCAYICYENMSFFPCKFSMMAYSVNGITVDSRGTVTLDGNSRKYARVQIDDKWMEQNYVTSIEEIKFLFDIPEAGDSLISYSGNEKLVSVSLAQKGKAEPYVEGDNVIFDKNGVKIILDKFSYELGGYGWFSVYDNKEIPTWHVTVINNNDYNVVISQTGDSKEAIFGMVNMTCEKILAHQRIHCRITPYDPMTSDKIEVRVAFRDWNYDNEFYDEEMTVLPIMEVEPVKLTPYMDALAEEQVLWETEDFCFRLKFFGNNDRFDEPLFFSLENKTDKDITVSYFVYEVNGLSFAGYKKVSAKPKETVVMAESFDADLENENITSIESLGFNLLYYAGNGSYSDELRDTKNVQVNLKTKGKAEECTHGSNVIFEEEGVKVILEGFEVLSDGRKSWKVTVVNDRDDTVIVGAPNNIMFDNPVYVDNSNLVWISPINAVGPGQHLHGNLHHNKKSDADRLNVRFRLSDVFSKVFFEDDELTTFYVGDGENVTKQKIG